MLSVLTDIDVMKALDEHKRCSGPVGLNVGMSHSSNYVL